MNIKKISETLLIYLFFKDTSDCGVTRGCYLSPTNCQGISCKFIYKYTSDANSTFFNLYANVGSTVNSWIGIGFSFDQAMVLKTVLYHKNSNIILL